MNGSFKAVSIIINCLEVFHVSELRRVTGTVRSEEQVKHVQSGMAGPEAAGMPDAAGRHFSECVPL